MVTSSIQSQFEGKAFLTVKDLESLGYGSRATIWREINSGVLPAFRTRTGRVLVPRDEFLQYLDSIRISPAQPEN